MAYNRSAIRARGDYRRMRGDPGLFKTLGKVLGGAARIAGVVGVPGAGIVGRALQGGGPQTQMPVMSPVPGVRGWLQRQIPGGATGYVEKQGSKGIKTSGMRKRPRMNVGNARALRRAIRRQEGFVKLARRALKGTGYTIVSRGSRSRRPITIREHGPGSVNVR